MSLVKWFFIVAGKAEWFSTDLLSPETSRPILVVQIRQLCTSEAVWSDIQLASEDPQQNPLQLERAA